MERNMDILI